MSCIAVKRMQCGPQGMSGPIEEGKPVQISKWVLGLHTICIHEEERN
jgi:hypothetical protein